MRKIKKILRFMFMSLISVSFPELLMSKLPEIYADGVKIIVQRLSDEIRTAFLHASFPEIDQKITEKSILVLEKLTETINESLLDAQKSLDEIFAAIREIGV